MAPGNNQVVDVKTVADGAAKLFENAVQLYEEALVLRREKALSRSFCLHQISLEECAKIEMLGAFAASVMMGESVDLGKFFKAFASHKAKNHANAYFLPVNEAEAKARQDKRWNDATEAFKQLQVEFHSEANTAKNASLYVDFEAGRFLSPKDRITEQMVQSIAEMNEGFLSTSAPKVELLFRWIDKPMETQEQMAWMKQRLVQLVSETEDPEHALNAFLDEVLARFTPKS